MSPRVRTEKREGGIVRISHLGSAADIQGEDKKKKKSICEHWTGMLCQNLQLIPNAEETLSVRAG